MARLTSPVTTPLSTVLMHVASVDSKDVMGDLVSSGHVVEGACEVAIIGGGAVAALAHNWVADSVGAGGAWDWLSGWAKIVIGASCVGGWTQAYALPMLPMIHVLWLTIGWMVALVEGAIAAPVLAFLFVRMDGQELIDSVQRPGLIIAANICCRPIFGTLGLIASYYLLPIGVGLVGRYFPTAWLGTQSTHTVTLGGLVGVYVLMVYLEYQVVARLLGLVSELPDRILRWWGSPGENLHEGTHAAGAGAVGAAVGGSIGRGPGASKIPSGPKGGGAGTSGGSIAPAPSDGDGGGASKIPEGDGSASKMSTGSAPPSGSQAALPAPTSTYTAGENPGVMIDGQPSNGSSPSSGSGGSPWYGETGGISKMSPTQAASARMAYDKWSAGRTNAPSFGSYVDYAQHRHSLRTSTARHAS